MVIRNFAKYWAAALLAVACTVQDPVELQAPTSSEPASSSSYVPGVVVVEFDETMAAQAQEDPSGVIMQLGATSLERVFPEAGEFEARHRRAGLHRFYYVKFSEELPVTKAAGSIRECDGVMSATPDRIPHLRSTFNDPYLSKQWHLVSSKEAVNIHVEEVWENYTVGDPSVVVAVMDEAVQYNHQDLAANMWNDGNGHNGYNQFLDNYTLNYTYTEGHGTHVAGIISAVNNNGKGISSVAGGDAAADKKGVAIMSVPVFAYTNAEALAEEKDQTGQLMLNGYVWAADHGAVISQNSWGYGADDSLGEDEGYDVSPEEMAEFKSWSIEDIPSLKAALDYFMEYAGCDDNGNQLPTSPMKGGLVFFAAGNEGDYGVDYDPVCDYDPVIAVGAFNHNGQRSSYSNFGDWVDIAAPGGEGTTRDNSIWSTVSSQYSTSEYGGTGWSGTSMACPHASGVAALIVSYFGGPGFTAQDARSILLGGLGSTIGGDKPIGRKLNALGAFEWALKKGYTPGGGSSEAEAPIITLDQKEVTVKAHQSVSIDFTVRDPNGDAVTLSCIPGSQALVLDQEASQLKIDGWKATPGTYTAVLTASDGKLSSQASLQYTLLSNHAPQAIGSVEDAMMTGLQRVVTHRLDGLFADEDGEDLVFQALSSDETCARVSFDKEDGKDRLVVSPVGYGNATITVSATDFLGETVSLSFRVAVVNPDQPVRVTPEVASKDSYISIETQDPVTVTVKVYSSTGALVMETQAMASVFDPLHLDVSTLAPGRYTVVLEYGGETRRIRIVKY